MKKILLMGIISFGALTLCLKGVKAETLDLTNVSETGQSVTVGEVDVPVYSVDITWGNMTFDYKYNNETGQYYWKTKEDSQEYDMTPGHILIEDNSKYGSIRPSIYWQSEQKYDFVDAHFYYEGFVECGVLDENLFDNLDSDYIYTDATCETKLTDTNSIFEEGKYYGAYASLKNKLSGNLLPDNSVNVGMDGKEWYHLQFELVNNLNKESKLPITGDKIGTVTISIDAK